MALFLKAGYDRTTATEIAARGAGGGIAAVYNVPVGAALFAKEVLLGSLSLSLVPQWSRCWYSVCLAWSRSPCRSCSATARTRSRQPCRPAAIDCIRFRQAACHCCLPRGRRAGRAVYPSLTTGAALGLLFGHAVGWLMPGAGPAAVFALVGAGAVLAATTQGPLSALVLFAELTWRIDPVLVAIALAIPGALLVARRLDARSVYTGRIHAGRAQATGDATTLSSAARYGDALEAVAGGSTALTVVDERGDPLGVLDADDVRDARRRCRPINIATARDMLRDAL